MTAHAMQDPDARAARRRVPADRVAGGVAILAIALFAWSGTRLLIGVFNEGTDRGDPVLGIALILNIALIIFAWRRYAEFSAEVLRRTASEERAHSLAARDPLTGFLNRRSLIEGVGAMLAQAQRRQKAVAMMMVDLDCFKQINDLHGHDVGDKLLQAMAARLELALPPASIAARLGGDEFAIAFLFDAANAAAVDAAAERVIVALSQPATIEGLFVQGTGSLGIARSDLDCPNVETLTRRADIAMYAAKKQGKNRALWFEIGMERELEARNQIISGLRKGIPAGEFVPYYEQQIDIVTGHLHGFEALARWEHPTRGVIMPEIFIPVAEETGLIMDLSVHIMRRAMQEARDWDPSLTLSVNISPLQLRDPWLAQKIVKLLAETDFPPERLEIEITETALFDNLGLAQSIVGSLKNQGIGLALDDFGTGYSSLAHLRALPFDRIKIDRSFVTSINDKEESAAIVDAIVRLGESLKLPVTAEGIEDARIQDNLRARGTMKGQGWHYGKPMTAAQTRRMLAERGLLGGTSGKSASGG